MSEGESCGYLVLCHSLSHTVHWHAVPPGGRPSPAQGLLEDRDRASPESPPSGTGQACRRCWAALAEWIEVQGVELS